LGTLLQQKEEKMSNEFQSDLMLDVHLAGEIKNAARRAGATPADLKRLAEKDMFAKILPVILGFSTPTPLVKFERWRTVSVNQGLSTGKQFVQELNASGVRYTQFAEAYLHSKDFAAIDEDRHYNVFLQTAEDLGFKSPMTRYDVVKRLQVLSFSPCPDEVPLRILLQETLQIGKRSGWPIDPVNVAMTPWIDSLRAHVSLSVQQNRRGTELNVLYADGDHKYPIQSVWMFVRRRGLV
jgi:hypothetical protein